MNLDKDKKIDIKIGTTLQKVRKSLGLTQEQVAEQLDLASRYISDIERNKVKGSIDTLIGLCNIYNITPTFVLKDYLINYTEKSVEPTLIGYDKLSDHDKKIIAYKKRLILAPNTSPIVNPIQNIEIILSEIIFQIFKMQ